LLRDCVLVGRMLEGERPSARRRLEWQLGKEFARRLVYLVRRRRAQFDNGV
jgi:hypothetical protein